MHAVESAIDELCSDLEARWCTSSSEEFIEQHCAEIAEAAEMLEENDKKLRMIEAYVQDWETELALVRISFEFV